MAHTQITLPINKWGALEDSNVETLASSLYFWLPCNPTLTPTGTFSQMGDEVISGFVRRYGCAPSIHGCNSRYMDGKKCLDIASCLPVIVRTSTGVQPISNEPMALSLPIFSWPRACGTLKRNAPKSALFTSAGGLTIPKLLSACANLPTASSNDVHRGDRRAGAAVALE
jgi:hypothetical protein